MFEKTEDTIERLRAYDDSRYDDVIMCDICGDQGIVTVGEYGSEIEKECICKIEHHNELIANNLEDY